MTRPKILKETRLPVEERAPPLDWEVSPHDWLSEESRERYDEVILAGTPFEVYLVEDAEKKMREHAEKDALKRLEVMGFLLGEVRSWKGKLYVVIRSVGTTELRSSSSKVRFDPDAFPKLFHQLDDSGFDYILVGWYHSHPGHTCFLSKTDLDTQRAMFDQPYHCAIVIDPINREIRTFRLTDSSYDEIPFAICRYKEASSARSRQSRRRKLKVKPVTSI